MPIHHSCQSHALPWPWIACMEWLILGQQSFSSTINVPAATAQGVEWRFLSRLQFHVCKGLLILTTWTNVVLSQSEQLSYLPTLLGLLKLKVWTATASTKDVNLSDPLFTWLPSLLVAVCFAGWILPHEERGTGGGTSSCASQVACICGQYGSTRGLWAVSVCREGAGDRLLLLLVQGGSWRVMSLFSAQNQCRI